MRAPERVSAFVASQVGRREFLRRTSTMALGIVLALPPLGGNRRTLDPTTIQGPLRHSDCSICGRSCRAWSPAVLARQQAPDRSGLSVRLQLGMSMDPSRTLLHQLRAVRILFRRPVRVRKWRATGRLGLLRMPRLLRRRLQHTVQ